MDVLYIMEECRCRVTEEGLRVIRANKSHHRVCREHRTRIAFRVTTCVDCGIEFEQHRSGQLSPRCEPCRTDEHHEKMRIKAYKYRLKKKGVFSVQPDGSANGECPLFQGVCKVCIKPYFRCEVAA
jgi:hypothetical protein